MYFGATFSVTSLIYLLLLVTAAPPTTQPVNEFVENASLPPQSNASTEDIFDIFTDLQYEAFNSNDSSVVEFEDPVNPAETVVGLSEPLKCDKSDSFWMCQGKISDNGGISLVIDFQQNGINIQCSENITCEQFPEMKGKLSTTESLKIQRCPALSASCVLRSGAVPATQLTTLLLENVSLDGLETLVGLQDLMFSEYGAHDPEPWLLPIESLVNMTSLATLRVHSGRATLPPSGVFAPASLRRLELVNLAMTKFPQKPFANLANLTSLGLWSNELNELDQDVFFGLNSLKSLNLNLNNLSSVPKASLALVPTLTQLSLRSNHIARISAGDFEGLIHLTSLDLSDNRKDLVIKEGAFSELVALKSLKLVRSHVVALSAIGSPALLKLDLSHNRIRALSTDTFHEARFLTSINLDDNQLEELPRDMLQYQSSLTTLSVRHNYLNDVTSSALSGARYSLTTLLLSNNNLSFTQEDYQDLFSPFNNLLNLSELDLSWNLVSDIFNDWRFILLKLQKLDLSHNRIPLLTEMSIDFIQEQIKVNLRYNNITSFAALPPDATATSTGSVLLVGDNPLRCDCNLHAALALPRPEPAMLQTRTLRLDMSGAQCASPAPLRGLPVASLAPPALLCELRACPAACRCRDRPATHTIEVDCDAWPLNETLPALPSTNYSYAVRLESISAAKAALGDMLSLPEQTRVLNCSGLNVSAVPISRVEPPKGLLEVDLRGNGLSVVPELALTERGPYVLVADNPLLCDCEHAVGLEQLERRRRRVDYEALRCAGGAVLATAGDSRALCLTRDATIAGGALAAFALVLALVALLLWRYSLQVRGWLAARGVFTRWIDAEEFDCEFDAFVSYSHLDEKFVTEELVPALEGARQPRALCLHYRDWRAGEPIASNVAASVARSRRTLVVLSRNFLASEWGRLEFRVAVAAALRGARGVLLVLLEDVRADPRLDGELAAYISTHTYLRYDDANFWPRLLRALPAAARRKTAPAG